MPSIFSKSNLFLDEVNRASAESTRPKSARKPDFSESRSLLSRQPIPVRTERRNGILFEVPAGYASLEDYASTVRFNFKHRNRLNMRPSVEEEYRQIIAKLEAAGL